MSLTDLDVFSISRGSYGEILYPKLKLNITQRKARKVNEDVIHGCKSCQRHVKDTVKISYDKLLSLCINSDYSEAWGATEEFSQTISPLCHSCRVTAYNYVLSVQEWIAYTHSRMGRYHESIAEFEKIVSCRCLLQPVSLKSHMRPLTVSRGVVFSQSQAFTTY